MTPEQLSKLKVAADLSYARSLRRLAPVEAERRRLRELLRTAEIAAAETVCGEATAFDLAAAAEARAAARRRIASIEVELHALSPHLEEARSRVRKALAKTEVVDDLIEKARTERLLAEDAEA